MDDLRQAIFSRQSGSAVADGPLYLSLQNNILKAIEGGVLRPGDALPSERDIAELADVSRVTVRKAVHNLVSEGLLVQRHGSGTFVAPRVQRVQQSLSSLTSFTEDMARRGMTAESVWLDRGLYPPSPEEMVTLGLSATDRVARVERLRLANGTPLAIERASLAEATLPDPSLVENSLYACLKKSGNRPVRAIQRLSAALLGKEDAELLGVPYGSPTLNIERISYLPSGKVIEFTRSRYRGDAYDFVAELRLGEGR
ncbi:MAG: phage tail protein [Rhizobiales bacterium 65-79]|jgi:GntR family transcriptional regulator|nr:GntR family transcriptional regulator [Hyphomicrobiales bacterium]OJU06158.1 MAG: phage tail protein [Rhizobiales bacterium 65-79]